GYLTLHGDQVVTVPDGTYDAGDVENAVHPATNGAYKGWLVIQAQHRGKVIVDLNHAPLTIGENTTRILFVGLTFVNGPVYVEGQQIAFWYTDHSFTATEWNAVQHKKYTFPHTLEVYDSSSTDDAFYGVDAHDTGHAFDLS